MEPIASGPDRRGRSRCPRDRPTDVVDSYFGLRSVSAAGGPSDCSTATPCYLRSVLSQGYWPQSHLASPSADALRAEVQLIKDLGFNAARIHQKIEDPRFLFWADKLGLAIWGEAPNAYEFTSARDAEDARRVDRGGAPRRLPPVRRCWVPLNESWGVPTIAPIPPCRTTAWRCITSRRALDPTRPVVSNDGWEHPNSDIWTVHDYEAAARGRGRYRDAEAQERLFRRHRPRRSACCD